MMRADLPSRLREYVRAGGRLLLTTMSALVDEHDNLFQGECPVPLRDVAGVWAEETDALPENLSIPLVGESTDAVVSDEGVGSAMSSIVGVGAGDDAGADGAAGADIGTGGVLCDIIHPDAGTRVFARYGGDMFYAGTPAITVHEYGEGQCWYVGVMPDADAASSVVDGMLDGVDVKGFDSPTGVEITSRVTADGKVFTFVINTTAYMQTVAAPCDGTDLLSGGTLKTAESMELAPYDVCVIQ
jgi:beta-galactosidase